MSHVQKILFIKSILLLLVLSIFNCNAIKLNGEKHINPSVTSTNGDDTSTGTINGGETGNSLTFKSYHQDHHSANEQYESIINHLRSLHHTIEVLHSSNQLPISQSNDHFATIGSSNLLENIGLLKQHIVNKIPLILLNVNDSDKKNLCDIVKNVCTINGLHNILAYIPSTSADNVTGGFEHHKVFNWLNDTDSINENSNSTNSNESDSFSNQHGSITNLLVQNMLKSYGGGNANQNDGPITGLIPPTNTTIPFKYFESIIAKSFSTSIDPKLTSKVKGQTFSLSITNHVYLYKDNPNNCIYSIIYQDGYLFPDTYMGANVPNKAIGSFTTVFSISNTPTVNGKTPQYSKFNLQASSPQTVDQTHTTTTEVSTDMSIGVSFGVSEEGPGGGVSFNENWASSSSITNDISDYGVNEMSNPVTMSTSWVYHQQYPFDVYTNGITNFEQWYKDAFTSNGNIAQPPPLSVSTLQTSTSWKWRVSNSLIDKKTHKLPVEVKLSINIGYSLITCPGFYDSHHRLFHHSITITSSQTFDFNAF